MRVACVLIQHFPVQVEIRDNPAFAELPLVIGGEPWERKPVLDCSPAAEACGIRMGMSLYEAGKLCPQARFLPAREGVYEEVFNQVLAALDCFSPVVEAERLGLAYLDVAGLEEPSGPPSKLAQRLLEEIARRTGLAATFGVARGKFPAWVAARAAPAGEAVLVEEGKEAEFLAPLPVDLLWGSEELKRRLRLLGLRTLGDVASLPREAMEEQFGRKGSLAHDLALGIDSRPLQPRATRATLTAEEWQEPPLQNLNGVVGAVDRLLEGVVGQLSLRHCICARVGLRLQLENGHSWERTWQVKPPGVSKAGLLTLVRHGLEGLRLPVGVGGVRLTLSSIEREGGQPARLWAGERTANSGAVKAMSRELANRFGKSPLKRVILVDPHSPLPERRAVLTEVEG